MRHFYFCDIIKSMIILSISAIILIYFSALFVNNRFQYQKAYWFFEFCHFLGGFFTAFFLFNFSKNPAFIFAGVIAAGFMWEIWEFLIDKCQRIRNFLLKFHVAQGPLTISDTLLDLFLDAIGGLVFIK